MRLDDALKLATALAITDTDAYLTNAIDLGSSSPSRDVGAGEPLCMIVQVNVAAAGSTDTTDLIVTTSANADLSSHVAVATRRIANASLTADSIHVVPIPPGAIGTTKRYLGGRVELGSGDTLTVTAWLAQLKDVAQYDRYYQSGFRIDNVT